MKTYLQQSRKSKRNVERLAPMGNRVNYYDVVVIGAGWAGIGVSRGLQVAGLHHVVYERNRICETWRTQRRATFHMNTPNVLTVMPGDTYTGDEPEGYMTRDDFVRMVEDYARRHKLPIRENTTVSRVRPDGDEFGILNSAGRAISRSIVIATGNLNVPRRPQLASALPAAVHQIDASDYRDAQSLPPGAILVVGSGNSGGQIAEDLVQGGRAVFLSTGRNGQGQWFRLGRVWPAVHLCPILLCACWRLSQGTFSGLSGLRQVCVAGIGAGGGRWSGRK